MKNILVLQRHAPYSSSHGREALDMILALAAVEHNIVVLFQGDSVYQLLTGAAHPDFLLKAYPRSFKLFDLYDVSNVCVCQHALQQRNIASDELSIAARVIDSDEQQKLIAAQHQVISC